MPRFVVLHHRLPPESERASHFDFMLEAEGVLQTWALAEAPAVGHEIAAERLADHRLNYLDYEGAISGGRGNVVRFDQGTYEPVRCDSEQFVVSIQGERLRGIATFARKTGAQTWTFLMSSAADERPN